MNRNKSFQERYLRNGLSSFSKIEMLEFLLSLKVDDKDHHGLATKLTNKYKSLNDIVDESDLELKKISGFQPEQLVGLKLPYHFSNIYLLEKSKNRPVTTNPRAVYNYLKHSMRGYKTEYFNVLYLNSCNEILNNEVRFKGTINQVTVYPREIIKSAIEYNAIGLILAHNHPSGNLNPSDEDFIMTKCIDDASKLMGINLIDHIIIAGDKYLSFSKEGFL